MREVFLRIEIVANIFKGSKKQLCLNNHSHQMKWQEYLDIVIMAKDKNAPYAIYKSLLMRNNPFYSVHIIIILLAFKIGLRNHQNVQSVTKT